MSIFVYTCHPERVRREKGNSLSVVPNAFDTMNWSIIEIYERAVVLNFVF